MPLGNTASIVLEDSSILAELCGVNDSNLRVLENLIESPVLSRGNELFIDTPDQNKQNPVGTSKIKVCQWKGHCP